MIVFLGTLLLTVSCSDYLDVDTDKDNPKTAPLDLLLTNTQVNLSKVGDFDLYSGNVLEVYTHQMTTKEDYDQYNTKPDNTFLSNDWNTIYLTLTNIETLILQSQASGNLVYLGIAQMQKAYLISTAVDLWGDVPYSEASLLTNNIISPKFDKQKEIYNSVFKLIETAKTNIASNKGSKKPSTDDLFYGGKTTKWIKFANTFKLKLYNQTRKLSINDFDTSGFNTLILENNFFSSIEDDFQFNHTANVAPNDERNRYFYQSYNSTQFGTFQSPWFYEILIGMNRIHNNNPDPRIKYYFFNQLKPGVFPPDQGDAATGNPKADYWDKSTGFFSIRFGSVGPYTNSSAENSYTYPGIFPAGGRYDDGQGGVMSSTTATGIAPHRILTYDEFLYIQAELILKGKIIGNAGTKLRQAMEASFAKVDQVVKNNNSKQVIPELVGSTKATIFMDQIMIEYNKLSTDKLEIIMTQKWVATYGDPLDQYNDYRRTGFPILANPNSTTKEYQLDNADGFPLIDSQTVLNSPYQLSFYWPQNELNVNKNAPIQKNPATYKIFWDVP
jgi:hypothetical protein